MDDEKMNVHKEYSSYKVSDIPWIIQIPSHWEVKPLFAVMKERQVRNIGNAVKNVLSLSYGKIVRRDISNNYGLLPESFDTYQIVLPGNIILRLTDLQNDKKSLRVGLVGEQGIITSAYTCLQIMGNINCRYAYYLLHSYDLDKVFYNFGSGVRQTMRFEDLKRLPILLPPPMEQESICLFLDREIARIDALIARYQRLIELLNENRAAIIIQAVTKGLNSTTAYRESNIDWLGKIPTYWKVEKIKNVSKILRGKFTYRPRNDPRLYDGKYPFIQTGDVTSASKYITTYKQTLNELGYGVSAEFPSGTLVMTIAANIGDTAILTFNACFPDSIVGLLPKNSLDSHFLYYVTKALKPVMLNSAVQNTQLNLNVERIGAISIPLPPKTEQEEIAQYLDEHFSKEDSLREKIKAVIERLHLYRNSLITSVVSGKINVTK